MAATADGLDAWISLRAWQQIQFRATAADPAVRRDGLFDLIVELEERLASGYDRQGGLKK